METILKLRVSTGKKAFAARFSEQKDLLIIETTQMPQKGKANKEITKKLKKLFKAEVQIVSGLTSREKIIKIDADKQQIMDLLKNTNYSRGRFL